MHITLDGSSLVDTMSLGVRTWGTSTTGCDVMLVGTYQTDGEVSRWLLDALPLLVVLRAEDWESPIIRLLADEAVKEEPDQQVVLDRLLDLLLVGELRADFANEGQWFVVNEEPAEVCENCGEAYVSEDVTTQVLAIAARAREAHAQVLVRDFAPAA